MLMCLSFTLYCTLISLWICMMNIVHAANFFFFGGGGEVPPVLTCPDHAKCERRRSFSPSLIVFLLFMFIFTYFNFFFLDSPLLACTDHANCERRRIHSSFFDCSAVGSFFFILFLFSLC